MVARSLLAALLALACAACAVSPPGGAASRPPTAVATTSAWGSILAQLSGSRVRTYSLIRNPNSDPHDYEPTPADARALSSARLVVENGVGYDAWAGRVLAASPDGDRVVLDVGDLVGASADANPHLWYSPTDVESLVRAATAALTKIDPADADYFALRQRRFDRQELARYHSLIADIRHHFSGVPIGASESVVVPLADALGLRVVTPTRFLRAVSEGSDVSAADTSSADRQIRTHAINVYVFNSQNSTPEVVDQVDAARAAGIPVVAVSETLTPEGASFQDWQVAQLEQLRAALHQATGR